MFFSNKIYTDESQKKRLKIISIFVFVEITHLIEKQKEGEREWILEQADDRDSNKNSDMINQCCKWKLFVFVF